jgi:RND family efflux transporter MFP subunit
MKKLALTFTVIVVVLGAAGAVALSERHAEYRALVRDTETRALLTVAVVHPTTEAAGEDLVLPATLEAFVDSPVYARTNGYLKKWYADIGVHVSAGDLLAEIDTPEVDQELAQAKANRSQIQANLELAKSSAERWENLRKTDAVSQQEVDEKKSAYAQAQANLAAADANVQRLDQLESFKRITAQVSGIVTKRNVEVGTLINAGNGGTQQQLFHISQTDPIRVFVSVPETAASSMKPGVPAFLVLAQFPGEKFSGKVVRTAGSFDAATRTLPTEVDVPNGSHRLLPGGYAQVHLMVAGVGARLQVPINALLFRAEGLRAAVVDASHHVHLRPLVVGRDYGTTLEVLQGLSPDDWIVINPADSLMDGQEVRVPEAATGKSDPADKTDRK